MALRGRSGERAALDRLLSAARGGAGGALVLHGEPGIGKTALLRHAVAAAEGFHVAEVAGVEAEEGWGHAALHRLLLSVAEPHDRLPAPQRDALGVALGTLPGPAPDRFLVGLATLTLLSDAAAAHPVLVVCDDAQWLDRESLGVLAFVGRRLRADRVVLLLAVQEASGPDGLLAGLPELPLTGLPAADAEALLAAAAGDALDPVLVARVAAAAGGNPLLLVELARELAGGEVTGAALAADPVLGGALPVGRRIESRFRARLARLPATARTVLLVLAADAGGDLDLVRRAAASLLPERGRDEVWTAVEECERAGLLVRPAPGELRFRHPLVRAAVYAGAPAGERRGAHVALAAATGAAADRQAWHRAAAADGPDEEVAAELERRAAQAGERGGHVAEAAFLARAAELTPGPAERVARLLAAGGAALTAGATQRAAELLGDVDTGVLAADAGPLEAQGARLRALLAVTRGRDGAVAELLGAAQVLRVHDRIAARDVLLEAFDAVAVSRRPGPAAGDVARAALELPPPAGPPDVADLLLAGHATLVTVGYMDAVPLLRAALAAMRDGGLDRGDAARWCGLGLDAAGELWDEAALGTCAARYGAAARARGAPGMQQAALQGLAAWELACGRFSAAAGHLTEARELAAAVGADRPRPVDAVLHAWRGEEEQTRAAVAAVLADAPERPGPPPVQLARSALVRLQIGQRRYPEAVRLAGLVHDEDPPRHGTAVLPDLVEAAVRAGDRPLAERALARLTERATAAGTPWALGLLARSRALVEPDSAAEEHHREALDRLGRTPCAPDLARAELLHGEWLRRRRRRSEAAARLSRALDLFTEMGARGFADRARAELQAAGGRPRPVADPAGSALTAQEARVASLAAHGATNQEIATALFLSPSTVEYHLRKVFRKLGITSRRQLRTTPLP